MESPYAAAGIQGDVCEYNLVKAEVIRTLRQMTLARK